MPFLCLEMIWYSEILHCVQDNKKEIALRMVKDRSSNAFQTGFEWLKKVSRISNCHKNSRRDYLPGNPVNSVPVIKNTWVK